MGRLVIEPASSQYLFDNHSQDTRYKGPLDVAPIVSATFGMGGNNQPFVVTPFSKSGRARSKDDATTRKESKVANTLNTFDMGEVRTNELVCMATQQGGAEIRTDNKSPTLTAAAGMSGNNKLSVAYGFDQRATRDAGKLFIKEKSKTLANGTCPGHHNGVVYHTPPRYIVRRLTPTECARLQGFADQWGHIEKKDSLTDEEYKFWLEVRNTHAAINGKKVQDYTEKQMLTWYNKLWTDSAEYKMWGNGIALPPALYCLQGLVDALNKPEEEDDEWML